MQSIYHAKGSTIYDIYRDLGSIFAREIHITLSKQKRKHNRNTFIKNEIAKRVWDRIVHNELTHEFVEAVKGWSDGARLRIDEAMLLLADNTSGCQTVIARSKNGVLIAHTEEDFNNISERMTPPQIVSIEYAGIVRSTMVYNDLLPGASLFGWQANQVVAVDSLFLREDGIDKIEKPMLANIIAWMLWWRSGGYEQEEIRKLIKNLGVVVDGYAVNVARITNGEIEAYKLTFTRDEIFSEELKDEPGNYLKQVNIIDPYYQIHDYPIAKWQLPPRNIYRGGWKTMTNRLKVIGQVMKIYRPLLNRKIGGDQATHELIQHEIFGKLADHFINKDVGAVGVAIIEPKGVTTSIAMVKNIRLDRLEYFGHD